MTEPTTESVQRHAVVTGGGSGIGAACVSLLREQGWQVAVWDVAGGSDDRDRIQVDVSDSRAVTDAAATVDRVDLLVNAAGVGGPSGPMHEQRPSDWDHVLAVCLSGTYYSCWALHDALARAEGVVVNIGSIRAELTAPGRAHYTVAKSGVHTLTRALGREWASHGIRVVAVSPGYTRTPMIADAIARGDIDGDALAGIAPMNRLAEPEEVAAVVHALAGSTFGFVTGTVIAVDGGSTA